MHFGMKYDFPIMEKLLGYFLPKEKRWDTFVQSSTQFCDRELVEGSKSGAHSLESWAIRLGNGVKVEHEDWLNFSIAIYGLAQVAPSQATDKYTESNWFFSTTARTIRPNATPFRRFGCGVLQRLIINIPGISTLVSQIFLYLNSHFQLHHEQQPKDRGLLRPQGRSTSPNSTPHRQSHVHRIIRRHSKGLLQRYRHQLPTLLGTNPSMGHCPSPIWLRGDFFSVRHGGCAWWWK